MYYVAGKECEGARKMEGSREEVKEAVMFIAGLHFPCSKQNLFGQGEIKGK